MSGYNSGGRDGGAFGNTNTRDSGYGSGNSGNNYDKSQSTNAGPHKSNLMNKLDPRVDSDRDNTRGTGAGTTGSSYGSGNSNTPSGYGNNQYDNPRSTNSGPHDSTLGNKADPRVDSDRDGRGGYGTGVGNTTGHHHGGYGNTQYDSPTSTTSGPHNSSLANKTDPRVDSDRDGRGGFGSGNTTGQHSGYGNAGPHDSSVANKADPRVDSDRDGRSGMGNTTGAGYGTGNTGNTGYGGSTGNYGSNTTGTENYGSNVNDPQNTNAGPHSSNMMNKLDPRVDSDRDGRSGMGNTTGGDYGNNNYDSNQPTQISSNAEGRGNGASGHKSNGSGMATANASVAASAGPSGAPEGQASASGPTSANANTTTSTNPIKQGINKLAGRS